VPEHLIVLGAGHVGLESFDLGVQLVLRLRPGGGSAIPRRRHRLLYEERKDYDL
jgi:hypothetical protein